MTLQKLEATSPQAQSANLLADNIAQLKALFPELVTEGANGAAINVDVLKALVGDATATDADEKYGLNWHGKRRARQLALTPSTGTLRPCPDESVDWDSTQNLMIEGDNLEVLKLLQKSYAGKVKLIYIDPPYNTGKDFVYPDNFQDNIKNYFQLTGQVDGGQKISSNTDASGRFHTDWLNMMYPRLKLARSLLQEDGVLLVSVDDAEIGHMKSILADIFGEENILAILIWNKQHSQQQGIFKRYHEYVIVLAKNAALIGNISGGEGEIDAGALKRISTANPASTFDFPAGVRFDATDEHELLGTYGDSEQVTVTSGRLVCINGKTVFPVTLSAGWTQKNQMISWFSGKETYDTKDQKVVEFYFTSTGKLKCRKERSKITPSSLLPEYGMVSEQTAYLAQLMGAAVFQNPKPVKMIADFISWFANPTDLVIDFFAGSGTTGESVFKTNLSDGGNRRYILVQLPEPLDPTNSDQKAASDFCDQLEKPRNIAELTKERLRRAAIKIRAASAPPTGATGQLDLKIQPEPVAKPLDLGFRVFKLDHSNIRAWNPDRNDLAQTLLDHAEHILPDRTEDDIMYELLLKLGLDLCVPMQSRSFSGKAVTAIGGGVLMTCLTEEILVSDVEALAQGIVAWHQELAPVGDTTCVFRDSAFENDVAKTNLAAILEQHGIQNVRSL